MTLSPPLLRLACWVLPSPCAAPLHHPSLCARSPNASAEPAAGPDARARTDVHLLGPAVAWPDTASHWSHLAPCMLMGVLGWGGTNIGSCRSSVPQGRQRGAGGGNGSLALPPNSVFTGSVGDWDVACGNISSWESLLQLSEIVCLRRALKQGDLVLLGSVQTRLTQLPAGHTP